MLEAEDSSLRPRTKCCRRGLNITGMGCMYSDGQPADCLLTVLSLFHLQRGLTVPAVKSSTAEFVITDHIH